MWWFQRLLHLHTQLSECSFVSIFPYWSFFAIRLLRKIPVSLANFLYCWIIIRNNNCSRWMDQPSSTRTEHTKRWASPTDTNATGPGKLQQHFYNLHCKPYVSYVLCQSKTKKNRNGKFNVLTKRRDADYHMMTSVTLADCKKCIELSDYIIDLIDQVREIR